MAQQWYNILTLSGGVGFKYGQNPGADIDCTNPYTRNIAPGTTFAGIGFTNAAAFALLPPGAVPLRMRLAARITVSGAMSGNGRLANGGLPFSSDQVYPLDPGVNDFAIPDTAFDPFPENGNTRIMVESTNTARDFTFEITQLDVFAETEDPPVSGCFWTDMLGVSEDCSEGGGGDTIEVSAVANGTASGGFAIEETADWCGTPSDAITEPDPENPVKDIRLVRVSFLGTAGTYTPPDCGSNVAMDPPAWIAIDLPFIRDAGGGFNYNWIPEDDPGLPGGLSYGWYWAQISVDGGPPYDCIIRLRAGV